MWSNQKDGGRVSAQRRQQAQQADELALAAGFRLAQDVGKLRPRRVFGDLALGAIVGQRAAGKQRQRQPGLGRASVRTAGRAWRH